LAVLRAMHAQGLDVLTEDTFVVLLEEILPKRGLDRLPELTTEASIETFNLPSLSMSPLQLRVHILMIALDTPILGEGSRIRLLNLYAKYHHWEAFWNLWRSPHRNGKPISSALYTCMFQRVAETKNQKACIAVLQNWVLSMELEDPVVKLEGDVAEAVKACAKVADPFVEQDANTGPEVKSEWVSLWRKCVGDLEN